MRLFFSLVLMTGMCFGQAWNTVCNVTGSVAGGNLASTCTIGANFPASRGFNWAIPYDSYNHEILYYAGESGGAHVTIYSFNLWGYKVSTHNFTLRVDQQANITDNTSACGYNPGSTTGQNANPTSGHPLAIMAFDSTANKWYTDGQLCQQYNNAYTSIYDATTHSMASRLAGQWHFVSTASCASGFFGCGGDSWNNGIIYVLGANATYSCCHTGAGSSPFYSKFDGSTWSDITSNAVGSDGHTCSSLTSTQCPPYLNAGKLMSDGTYIYLFGGCIGSTPGNGSGANACTTNSGTNNYDMFRGAITNSGNTITWTKLTSAGSSIAGTNSNFPFIEYDSSRTRFVYYAATNTLYTGTISGTTITWAALSATGNGPVIDAFLQDNSNANAMQYDPSTDTAVLFYARGQSVTPGVFELSFGGASAGGSTFLGKSALSGKTVVQ